MKKAAILISAIIIIAAFATYYFFKTGHRPSFNNQPNTTLQHLKEGNVRFVANKPIHQNYGLALKSNQANKHPKAVVLNCTDSPAIPAIIFDQNVNDIDTIQVAGNVINNDILATMEFATKEGGAAVIVILGHTNCDTVHAACKKEKFGHFTNLLQQIQPAVKTAEENASNYNCGNAQLIDAIAKQNVLNMMQQITEKSPVIADYVKSGQVKIVGGVYNSTTGSVIFTNLPDKSE